MSGKKSESVVVNHVGIKAAWSVSTLTIKDLMDMGGRGLVNTDLALQRPEMPHWSKPEILDALIDTVLSGYPMPPIFAASDGSVLSLYDGKQRFTAFRRIFRDLCVAPDSWTVKGGTCDSILPDTVRGKVFSEWDDASQDAFLGYPLIIVNTDFASDDDMQTLFIRLNKSGLPLTSAQAYRGTYLDKLTALDASIIDSVWETLKLDRPKVESLLMQVCNGAYSESPDYSSKAIPVWFASWGMLSSSVLDVQRAVNALSALVTFADTQPDDSKTFKRFCKPLHLESYLWAVASGVTGAGVVASDDHLRIVQFFGVDKGKGSAERDSYIDASQSATGSSSSVATRHSVISSVLSGGFTPPATGVKSSKTKPDSGKVTTPDATPDATPVDKVRESWAREIAREFGAGNYSAKEESAIIDFIGLLPATADPKLVEVKKNGNITHIIRTTSGDKLVADVIQAMP